MILRAQQQYTSGKVMRRVTVGVVGFGHIGQYIVERLLRESHPHFIGDVVELAFVWNRTTDKIDSAKDLVGVSVPESVVLRDLDAMEELFPEVDVIVEVAHPSIYLTHGARLLRHASLFVGSPTAFAQGAVFDELCVISREVNHSIFLPCGALWGALDILKLGEAHSISEVHITMRKPPHSFKLEEPLRSTLDKHIAAMACDAERTPTELVLYEGPVRGICGLAPNNVNTMACLAMASGSEMGFDRCVGKLVADSTIAAHVIDIRVRGKPIANREDVFEVTTRRYNPCNPHEVTASATYPSFVASLKRAAMAGPDQIKSHGGIQFV